MGPADLLGYIFAFITLTSSKRIILDDRLTECSRQSKTRLLAVCIKLIVPFQESDKMRWQARSGAESGNQLGTKLDWRQEQLRRLFLRRPELRPACSCGSRDSLFACG